MRAAWPKSTGGPKLLADGEDLTKKGKGANRTDLHTNLFNCPVRCSHCRHCAES